MNDTGMALLFDGMASYALWIGLAGVLVALLTYRGIVAQSPGSANMQFLAEQIQLGAMAFLRREYMVLLPFLLVIAVLLSLALGWETGAAYILGGVCSVSAGSESFTLTSQPAS